MYSFLYTALFLDLSSQKRERPQDYKMPAADQHLYAVAFSDSDCIKFPVGLLFYLYRSVSLCTSGFVFRADDLRAILGFKPVFMGLPADGKPFPVECQFCDTVYEFTTDDIKKLIKNA